MLDAKGEVFRIDNASFRRIDFAFYRPAGLILGICSFLIGALTLSCFVNVAIGLEHVKSLPPEKAKGWIISLVNESPYAYPHALQGS